MIETFPTPGGGVGGTSPPIAQRAANLFRSMAKAGVALATGGQVQATEQVFEARMQACDPCDQRNKDWCNACGCWLLLKGAVATEECPLGKWPANH